MKKLPKDKMTGVAGTVAVHVLLVLLLYFLVLDSSPAPAEKGVEVMMGVDIENVAMAQVNEVPQDAVTPVPTPVTPAQPVPDEQLITQDEEESLALPQEEPEQQKPKPQKPEQKQPRPQKPEKTAEQIQQEQEEAERLENERREAEAMKQANSSIANAFNRGKEMSKKGDDDRNESASGSPQGNSDKGLKDGVGVGFSLEGRMPGGDGLIRPTYDVQASGRVVVNITVNPAGKVILATINLSGTNSADPKLRDAALKAARNTVFNSIGSVDNQQGTITYNFELTK